jgi:hypothetical protein
MPDEIFVRGKAGLADGLSLAAMKRLERLGLLTITTAAKEEPMKADDTKCTCGHPMGQHAANLKTAKVRCTTKGCRCRF